MKKTLLPFIIALLVGYYSNSQTTFKNYVTIDASTGEDPYKIASGDLDGDNTIDLVIGTFNFNGGTPIQDYIKWYKNDGAGNFTLQTEVSSSIRWIEGLDIVDIDGQNGLDIVATSQAQSKVVYFLSDGSGGFGTENVVDGAIINPGQIKGEDINKDGDIDLITTSVTDNKIIWYQGDGAGNFSTENIIDDSGIAKPLYIDIADFDGDSDLDVVVGYRGAAATGEGSIEIFYNQYIESGTMTVSWLKDTTTIDSGIVYLFGVIFGDANNDGTLDIISTDFNSGDVEWFNKIKNGSSTANSISNETIIDRPATIGIADLDNDTYKDIIVTDGGTVDDAVIWFKGANNSSPSTTESLVGDNNFQNFSIAIDDFDADGDMDIAAIGFQSNSVIWYENEKITLSANSFGIEKIKLYPNPVSNSLKIRNVNNESLSYSLLDYTGKNVGEGIISNSEPIDFSILSSGMYILHLTDYNAVYKIMKM